MEMPNKLNRHRKRMSCDFYGNILNSIGGQNIKTERDEENEEKLEKIYEQRRRMNPLKKYIKASRNNYSSDEEFYEKNKAYLANSKLDFEHLIMLINEIEKEEKEEKEIKEKIKIEKEKKEKEEREKILKEIREKKEKLKKIVNTNNFSININRWYHVRNS